DAGGSAEVLERDGGFYRLRFDVPDALESWLLEAGRLPLPPYIQRPPDSADAERYQTVFAREAGAVAAPTAGLHFDQPLLDALRSRGVETAHVTLHVGAGTFLPMRVEQVREHRMHSEWLNVGASLVAQVRRTREAGGRVIAVGTTVVRALESAMRLNGAGEGELQPYSGETSIFIFPGYRVRSVDALLTNFHLPESTLLMLVSAFAGRERVFKAYAHAIQRRDRFCSYGDAMLLFPAYMPIIPILLTPSRAGPQPEPNPSTRGKRMTNPAVRAAGARRPGAMFSAACAALLLAACGQQPAPATQEGAATTPAANADTAAAGSGEV